MQVQGAAREHDAAVAHARSMMSSSLTLLVRVMVALRVWGPGFGADLQLAVQHDPLGGQFKVGIVCEGELAVDGQTAQRRRADVEDHFLVLRRW